MLGLSGYDVSMAGGLSDWEDLKRLLGELNTNISDFNTSSTKYSKIIVGLTIVLGIIALVQIKIMLGQ